MSKYQSFIFKDYSFDRQSHALNLTYSYDNILEFNESYHFDFDFVDYDEVVLDRACQTLFFMAGVSYFKAYLPPKIIIEKGELDQPSAYFFSHTYEKGLGEFFYVNKLDPEQKIIFPTNTAVIKPLAKNPEYKGQLVGIGGGKDSLVTLEILRQHIDNLATWSVGHRPQLEPLIKEIGLPHLWVERLWDRKLLEHNDKGAFNGHIPISAILACVGTVVCVLSGRQELIVSNENSANEPSLTYKGVPINHQYSKSLDFELDYQAYMHLNFSNILHYYSFLRPMSEVYIAEVFAKIAFNKYKGVFSSCNRAFIHTSDHMSWCGHCPKCAFTFLALTPFIPRQELETIWGGKNLLLEPRLVPTYKDLLGISGQKPLDCVGEVKESRSAMRLAQKLYPELSKYVFNIPDDYSYKTLAPYSMPASMYELLVKAIR
jgi:hypothetical protein